MGRNPLNGKVSVTQKVIDQVRTALESKSTNITSHVKKILPYFKLQDGILYFNKYKSEEKKVLKDNLTDEQLERIIDMTQQLPKDVYDVQTIKTDKWVQILKEHEYEGIIIDIHVNQGHAGRDICESVASSMYYIPKFQEKFQKVKSSCESCRTKEASKAIVLDNHYDPTCVGELVFVECAFFPKCGTTDGWVVFVDGLSKYVFGFIL